MPKKNTDPERSNKGSAVYYDMTEESSKRPQQSGGTQQARQSESDDLNEETAQGPLDTPSGDRWAENKISTSLDDE